MRTAAAAVAAALAGGFAAYLRVSGDAVARLAVGEAVVDYSSHDLPKVRVGHRVMDLVHGGQFDDILQDTPDEMRPPAVVAFYDSSDPVCMDKYNHLKWDLIAEQELPPRERLFVARYDMHAAPRRTWYKFIPELDLAARFDVDACPQVVFAPRACNGFNEWCAQGPDPANPAVTVMGCKDFVDQCIGTEKWDGVYDLKAWILARVRREGEPEISPFLRTFKEQGEWIKRRDSTSVDNQMRNLYLSPAFPAFSKTLGFKAMPIPQPFHEWLLEFYQRRLPSRRVETWDSESTQMSFVEVKTAFVDMDIERTAKEEYANKYLKPLVEEWAGVEVELTSFYGQREYPDRSFLKNHVDRIDTHVLSVTLSISKLDKEKAEAHPWPIEVVDWEGKHVRYNHPAGTMVLYESAKLMHGRPYRNAGGTHLGAFCHFSPVVNVAGNQTWREAVGAARRYKEDHIEWARYRSTPSVEPDQPKYSKQAYAESTRWKHLGNEAKEEGNDEGALANGQIPVTFHNNKGVTLELYWVSSSPDGHLVHQGRAAPGVRLQVQTFPGHRFVWCHKDTQEPLPDSDMVINSARRLFTAP